MAQSKAGQGLCQCGLPADLQQGVQLVGGEPTLVSDTAKAGFGPLGAWVLLGQAGMLGIQLLLQAHKCGWEAPRHTTYQCSYGGHLGTRYTKHIANKMHAMSNLCQNQAQVLTFNRINNTWWPE